MQKGQIPILILVGILILVVADRAFYLGKYIGSKSTPTPIISQTPQPSPSPAPTDAGETVNFTFKYGVSVNSGDPRNILNTSNQTYTKDMISDKDVTTKLSLTNEERKQILNKMLTINLFELPGSFYDDPGSCKITITKTPYTSYDLTVTYGTRTKHLSWSDQFTCEENPNLELQKLRELGQFIINIIESKAEYNSLPQAKGGYL